MAREIHSNQTIQLVVDRHNPHLLLKLARTLEQEGYQVQFATEERPNLAQPDKVLTDSSSLLSKNSIDHILNYEYGLGDCL